VLSSLVWTFFLVESSVALQALQSGMPQKAGCTSSLLLLTVKRSLLVLSMKEKQETAAATAVETTDSAAKATKTAAASTVRPEIIFAVLQV
jgi:hypothetical protein